MGSLIPTSVAAHALGVTPDAIRMLRQRGKLTRHGTKQRALVDIDELTALTGDPVGSGTLVNAEVAPDGRLRDAELRSHFFGFNPSTFRR